MTTQENLFWQNTQVGRCDRQDLLDQRGCTIWFTGLSASGKSTTAFALERKLVDKNKIAYVLDGDNIRHGLNSNLGFGEDDRRENVRRIAEVAKLFADAGLITITSFISPYRSDRELAKQIHNEAGLPFLEIHMSTPLATCRQRDQKGLYQKAIDGEIQDFTGISAPYEEPLYPDMICDAAVDDVETSAGRILALLESKHILNPHQPEPF